MNRIYHFFILILFSFQLQGQIVSVETARQVAENFFHESVFNLQDKLSDAELKLDQTVKGDGIPLYYVFNSEDGNGYVLVSGSYSSYPIVGFSTEGTFIIDEVPPALDSLLSEYGNGVISMAQGKKAVDMTYYSTWDRYSTSESIFGEKNGTGESQVKPLIRSRWNSGCYYNSHCPEDPEGPCGHVKVGCVAVAMAQLMNYYGFPEHGHDSIAHVLADTTYIEYYDSTCYESPYGRLCMDFDSQSYQWEQMPDRLISDNESVAQLMYQCGIAARMDYGPDASWSSLGAIPVLLSFKFDYSDYIYSVEYSGWDNTYDMHNISLRLLWEETDSVLDTQGWAAHVRDELDHFRPVVAAGAPPSHGERHAYLIDGYYGSVLFHYNWGWGGQSDGYFPIGSESAYTHIVPGPCEKDTIPPNAVKNLSYHIDEDTVIIAWELPEMAIDGDLAYKYHVSEDDTHDIITFNRQYRFLWDTIGVYQIEVESLDECMQRGDESALLEVVLPDSVNYHPRIKDYSPKYMDTIPVYTGVYKFFEIRASDPNGDELAYSWQVGEDEISGGTAPRIVHDFRALEPGIHTMITQVSDQELTRQKTWVLNKIPGDLALIDDSDSIRMEGKWYERIGQDAVGKKYYWAMQWDYFNQPGAGFIYKPEFKGSYKVSAYIPFMTNLSDKVDYLMIADNIALDTFRISQADAAGKWITLGIVELESDAEVVVKVTNLENKPSDMYMVIDALRFQYGIFDDQPPIIGLDDTIWYASDTSEINIIEFTVTENSMVYLVPENTFQSLTEIQAACIDSMAVIANMKEQFPLFNMDDGDYQFFAVDSAGNISEPAIFSIRSVGVKITHTHPVLIYPNPANTLLNIEVTKPDTYDLEIASINGQVIYRQMMHGSISRIDLSAFRKGIYFITIRSKNFVTTRKFVKL